MMQGNIYMVQGSPDHDYGIKYESFIKNRLPWYKKGCAGRIMTTVYPFKSFLFASCFCILSLHALSQEEVLQSADSLKTITAVVDTTAPESKKIKKVNVYDPRKAALRSAMLPGWGQIYNRKYWKLPIVYAALGITAYIFIDNINTYREYRHAYGVRYRAALPVPDSTGYNELKEIYKIIEPGSIRAARDEFRRYIDYSVLFFVLFWGLNVVDAAVDAHLKSFDVSPDLSFRFKPGYSEMAGTTGLSFVVHVGKRKNTTLLRSRF